MFIKKTRNNKGFSLMEILIALAIMVGIGTFVAGNFMGRQRKSQVDQAKISISRLVDAMNTFYLDCSYYPSNAEGLEVLVTRQEKCEKWGPEPYLRKLPKDPWKNDFVYRYDESTGQFEIISLGKGGVEGGEDYSADISSKDL